MTVDLLIATLSLVALAVFAGIAVKGLLDASTKDDESSDDLMARAAKARDSGMPGFIAGIMRARRAAKVRAELPDALDMVSNSLSAGLTLPQALMRNLDHFPPLIAEEFARVEGILPAPESSHAIKIAMDIAKECVKTGEEKTIVFGLTGTGYFDMMSYEKFHDGRMVDSIPSDADIEKALSKLPHVEE